MYRIDWLAVTQVRIFNAEEVPITLLQVESAAKSIQTSFSFRQFSPISPPVSGDPMGGYRYSIMAKSKQDGVTIGIQQLVIEPRRINSHVHSTSEIANKGFFKT